ncbi:hypothetical protein HMPREF3039_02120 [Akkermansia sp. KLE1798]|nr:hypothetical protein HMPREF3039_02120 [Akkermansia sp. KLE1798]
MGARGMRLAYPLQLRKSSTIPSRPGMFSRNDKEKTFLAYISPFHLFPGLL